MRFAIFPLHLSKVLRLPRKKWGQVIRSAAPFTQNHLNKATDLMLQNATSLRKSAPGPPNSSDEQMNMSLVLHLPRKMHLCRSSSNVPRLPSFLEMLQNPRVLLTSACYAKPHLNLQKRSEHVVFSTFWLGNVLCATTARTFSTSQLPKSGPNMVCFCTCWLRNMLWATTACNFSSLIWPHGSAPAALKSLLFEPPEPQIIGKTQCFTTFLPFRAPASSSFWLFLISLLWSSLFCSSLLWLFPPLLFHLSILSEVWLLNFLR